MIDDISRVDIDTHIIRDLVWSVCETTADDTESGLDNRTRTEIYVLSRAFFQDNIIRTALNEDLEKRL